MKGEEGFLQATYQSLFFFSSGFSTILGIAMYGHLSKLPLIYTHTLVTRPSKLKKESPCCDLLSLNCQQRQEHIVYIYIYTTAPQNLKQQTKNLYNTISTRCPVTSWCHTILSHRRTKRRPAPNISGGKLSIYLLYTSWKKVKKKVPLKQMTRKKRRNGV